MSEPDRALDLSMLVADHKHLARRYGQLIFSSGNADNTTWTPPIAGEKTLQELNEEIGRNSLSTVFLPGSVSPLHDVDAFARPPTRRIRLRYEEKVERLEHDWKPFVEVEYDLPESADGRVVEDDQAAAIRGCTGGEQVQYCLRPARSVYYLVPW